MTLEIQAVTPQLLAHGGIVTIRGSGFSDITSIQVGQVAQSGARIVSDREVVIVGLLDETLTGDVDLVLTRGTERAVSRITVARLLLSESNSLPNSDEFVEVRAYDQKNYVGMPGVPTSGYALVVFDASGSSVGAVALDGVTNSTGHLLAGVDGMVAPDVVFTAMLPDTIGAVALVQGSPQAFPIGSSAPTEGLIDAIVYDANTEDTLLPDKALLDTFVLANSDRFPDEDEGDDALVRTVSRCFPHRTERRDLAEWVATVTRTPRETNVCP